MATTVQPLDERAGAQAAAIYRDGMVGLPGLFSSDWADRLLEDFEAAFADARSHPQGTVGRGPHRYYFAVHPERVRGFAELVTHPRISALCEQVLGPDYQIVELGFDVPMAGAVDQPWHRDFLMPPETVRYGRLSSLAFNLTTVDVTPDLAPFEIALGTQFDDGDAFDHGMFPRAEDYPRLASLAARRYPRRGDVSCRTGLTLHRGTRNLSNRGRPMLILGVVSAEVTPEDTSAHQLTLTRRFADGLPAGLAAHLRSTVVLRLKPIVQQHDIEGLMMGGDPADCL